MDQELTLRIVLEKPTKGVDFGLQKGKGHEYEIFQKQRSVGANLFFEFQVKIKTSGEAEINFGGPFVQGPPTERFVYIGIGTFAGQTDSPWNRRLKVPLRGITHQMVQQSLAEKIMIQTFVPGVGKDGGPNCATVKPFAGWKLTSVG